MRGGWDRSWTPYCSVDKYSGERERVLISLGAREAGEKFIVHRGTMFTSPWSVNRVYTRDRICLTKGPIIDPFPPLPPPLHFSRRPVNRKRRFGHVSTPEPFEVAIKGRFPGGCPRARFFVFLISLVRAGIRIICPFRFIEKKFFFFFFVYIYRIEEGFLFYSSLLGKQKKSLISLHILLHEN